MKTKTIVLIVILVVVLGGLFFVLKPKDSVEQYPPNSDLVANPTMATTTKVFNLVVQNRKIVSGGDSLEATEGDTVTMNITLDETQEVHLHGYNKMIDLTAGVPGALTFTADMTGRFPFELEGPGVELGTLDVLPK